MNGINSGLKINEVCGITIFSVEKESNLNSPGGFWYYWRNLPFEKQIALSIRDTNQIRSNSKKTVINVNSNIIPQQKYLKHDPIIPPRSKIGQLISNLKEKNG
ncbi:hypothetical protein Trydic_g3733 [Trypoxylus dichotomus]